MNRRDLFKHAAIAVGAGLIPFRVLYPVETPQFTDVTGMFRNCHNILSITDRQILLDKGWTLTGGGPVA